MRLIRTLSGLVATAAASALVALQILCSPAAAATLPDFGSEPVQDTSSPGGSSITEVRVGANDGFDRFVVEFEGDIGAYFVSYVDQVAEDGSGAVVPVDGSAFIQVSLNGIPNEPQAPQQTIEAGLTGLIQVVGAGAGFEATASYGLGTAQAAGFRVFTLTEPTRLVVDIAHPDVTPTASNTADPSESAQPSPSPTSAEVTPDEAAAESDSPSTWLIFLLVGLALIGVVAGIVGWRMRRPSEPRQ
ncbi:hypothetical protein BH24ACT9_BH24ACT9_15110 [soil metagenome]